MPLSLDDLLRELAQEKDESKKDEIRGQIESNHLFDGLNIDQIFQIGRTYISGDKSRELDFLKLLAASGKIYGSGDVLYFFPLFSPYLQAVFASSFGVLFPELKEIREIGLIMGLKGSLFEGYNEKDSNLLTKQRFQNFSRGDSEPLAFHLIEHYQNASAFLDPIQEHGDLHGIHATWEQHEFSFHLIKDGKKTHLIYVNRGQRHELARNNDPAVTVFTFNDSETMNPVISRLIDALKTKNRTTISAFIHNDLQPYQNSELSQELRKSNQKVGNCPVANANIAWH